MRKKIHVLLSVLCAVSLHAQTAGQFIVPVKTAGGRTETGVTLSNGQVLGKSGGVPAAITPFDGVFASLTSKPTTLSGYGIADAITAADAAATYQPINGKLTAFGSLANAVGILANDGNGAFSYTGSSAGGNGATDAGKLAKFNGFGGLQATTQFTIFSSSGGGVSFDVGATAASSNITVPVGVSGTLAFTSIVDSLNASNISSGSMSLARLAQGGATSGQAIAWNGSAWAPATVGVSNGDKGDITVTDDGGTWSVDNLAVTNAKIAAATIDLTAKVTGILPVANGGTGISSLGAGVATWLGTPSLANFNSALSDADVATTGANTFTGAQTIGSSNLLLSTNGTITFDGTGALTLPSGSKFKLHANIYSEFFLANANGALGVGPGSGGVLLWHSGGGYIGVGAGLVIGSDTFLNNPTRLNSVASGHIVVGSSTAAQRLSVVNTWTSITNNEVAVLDWQTTSNTLRIGSAVGSGGGTARDVALIRGGTVKATIGANTTDHTQPIKLPSYIVSGLPSASTCGAGSMAFVTDATATTTYSVVAGGGSNKVLVISDGTDWIIH